MFVKNLRAMRAAAAPNTHKIGAPYITTQFNILYTSIYQYLYELLGVLMKY